ncbi:hypothetical protein CYMTET_7476 [Cymbomonas tetramitiformis]|uniref:Uncharacterized protein n=1 Tax=Cymbomonas tetramitiformis TaxID=36881 RepID=A0AAE0LHF8_9CHLO|nr:hypothetical protein CYMTET_7476 [Cymbomonas tetramitiformis]
MVSLSGQCTCDGKDHPGQTDPPDDIPHFVGIVMIKGATEARDAPPGQPDTIERSEEDEIHQAFTWYTKWHQALHKKIDKRASGSNAESQKVKGLSTPDDIWGDWIGVRTHTTLASVAPRIQEVGGQSPPQGNPWFLDGPTKGAGTRQSRKRETE